MSIEDKALVLAFLRLPRLRLTEAQLGDIERVIDGAPGVVAPVAVPYAQAAEMLGLGSIKSIERYIREGRLTRTAKGRVSLASVRHFAEGGEE